MCPKCQCQNVMKYGFFLSGCRKKKVQRFFCKKCRHCFSDQTFALSYRHKKPRLNQPLFQLLCSGVSQRRCAILLRTRQATVARKLLRLGVFADLQLKQSTTALTGKLSEVVFDEMETFEHTKCKPLSIVVAVEKSSRQVLSFNVARMPAKGKLAAISRKKYGKRVDDRPKALSQTFAQLKTVVKQDSPLFISDQCPRYPFYVKSVGPTARHETHKGRRGCVVGMGELKAGGFDPLFSLNHTCAMTRDGLKRLSRRTWCTTKKPDRLQALLNMYGCFHNQRLKAKRFLPLIIVMFPKKVDREIFTLLLPCCPPQIVLG